MNTLNYYDTNAEAFVESTKNVEFTSIQNRFLNLLINKESLILDFGCGSGRDTKYFLEKGYKVDAIDGSIELCKLASEYTGIKVKHLFFQELNEMNKYDGIWACASILHVKKNELVDILQRLTNALKKNGILYTSFKYGDFEGERNGRYFTNLNETSFKELVSKVDGLSIIDEWITGDARVGRGGEQWLNVILQKN